MIDTPGSKAVPGAVLEWRRGTQRQQGTTDGNGFYSFSIPATGGGSRGDSSLSIAAWGNLFQVTRRDVDVRSGQTVHVDFALHKKPLSEIGEIRGRVTDTATALGVGGVTVAIIGAGNLLSTQTKTDGSYSISRVGLGQVLTIRVTKDKPPCLTEEERSFAMMGLVAVQDFPLKEIYSLQRYCPTNYPRQFPPP